MHGSIVTVTAIVEGVAGPVTRELTVFSPKIDPLVGRWHEERGGVAELSFQSDGRYTATWLMLESQIDLFGDYSVHTSTGKIELIKNWERAETRGFQGQGDFSIDDQDQLTLTGVCPTKPDPENPKCIRRFIRFE